MKNKKVSMKTMIVIVLIGISIILILSNLNNKNNNINKQDSIKEQLTQTTSNNAYVSMSDHLKEVNNQSSGRKYIIKDGVVQEGWNVTLGSTATYNSIKKCLDFGSGSGVLVGVTDVWKSAKALKADLCIDFYIGGTPGTRITTNSKSGGGDYLIASNVSRVRIELDEIGWWTGSTSNDKYLYNMWLENMTDGPDADYDV